MPTVLGSGKWIPSGLVEMAVLSIIASTQVLITPLRKHATTEVQ